MSIISKMRKQKAVYWQQGLANEFGMPTHVAPVEIDCRWENVTEEFRNPNTDSVDMSNAVVYTDRVMTTGDVLLRGLLADVALPDDPRANEGAWEVRRFDELPNLKNTETLYTAYL